MVSFKSPYAEKLLSKHLPRVADYFCEKIGLEPNAENLALIDNAYAELEMHELVANCPLQFMSMGSNLPAKSPYILTEKGIIAQGELT